VGTFLLATRGSEERLVTYVAENKAHREKSDALLLDFA
jgi:hypothetical protein